METEAGARATTRPRGRPKVASDAAQRAQIVDVGRRLFLERGYGRATMGEAASRARVSKQTLYRFFSGKAELFAAVVEAHRHSMLALPSAREHASLDDALAAIFRVDIDEAADRERHALLAMAFRESAVHPELGEAILRHGVAKSRADLAEWLEERAAAGDMVVDDAEALAQILMDMMFGAARPPPPFGEAEPAETRRRRLRTCIAVFLDGTRAGADRAGGARRS
ncbi:MAG: TetR/AcrR family transcriptional regulator [Hyphomicrobiales bacterium]|nr:TetR/AcrR family transcriptional regulator [Hyphomicrobiales bacterium]